MFVSFIGYFSLVGFETKNFNKQIKENLLKEFETNGRNAYSLHNGINYYYNHQQGASNIKDESTRARIRMEQNYYGKNSLLIDRAKELCLAL